jgi:hypothetical protein
MWAVVALVAALATVPMSARADLILGFGGNTQPEINAGGVNTQGFINFAVFNTAGGTAGDHFGTGFAGIDATLTAAGFNTSSNFLYLFQVANVGVDIASASVNVKAGDTTGHGFLTGITYAQVSSAHEFLGLTAAAPGNISPAVTNATQGEAMATALALAVSPSSLTLNSNSLVATFSPAITGSGFSSLWGYTSNLSPQFTLGSIQDGGIAANGVVPGAAVPEPSSAFLALTGIVGGGIYAARRRRKLRVLCLA